MADTTESVIDTMSSWGYTAAKVMLGIWVVIMLFFVYIIMMASRRPEHFKSGFRLGSYDPARYASDWIVRRP